VDSFLRQEIQLGHVIVALSPLRRASTIGRSGAWKSSLAKHYRFARGMEVDDDTCAVDLIQELMFCQDHTYLETQHTAHSYCSVGWFVFAADPAAVTAIYSSVASSAIMRPSSDWLTEAAPGNAVV